MDRVQQIIELEAAADKLNEEYESNRWETARLYSEELAAGKSQRALAAEVGKSKTHVYCMAKCWEVEGERSLKRPFNTVYNSTEVRGEPKPKPEPEDKPKPGKSSQFL